MKGGRRFRNRECGKLKNREKSMNFVLNVAFYSYFLPFNDPFAIKDHTLYVLIWSLYIYTFLKIKEPTVSILDGIGK